jgi:membrane fusion protein, multidrug efflux system
LTNQLASARADLSASTSSAAAARTAYERARLLNADNKNVSDRAVEEATARLASEEARVTTATETVRLLETSLRAAGPAGMTSLRVARGGDVAEIMAQPGEAVEPGAPILRVAKLDRLLAKVDVPVGEHLPPSVSKARIFAVGYENSPIVAERIGLTATAEPAAQGQSFLFRLTATLFGLRPGLAVTARIPVAGPQQTGVVIPASAVVRVSGRAYVFMQTRADAFVRKEVTLDQPVDDGFVASPNLVAGERVVIQGAQLLLSEEFKSQLAAESDKS